MLYLLQTYGEDFSLLKIGFSDNLDRRLRLYYECNPLVKILSTREGDKRLESFMHRYFREFKYPELNEWFYYNDSIVKNFNLIEVPYSYDFSGNLEEALIYVDYLPRFEERLKYLSLYLKDSEEDLSIIPEEYSRYLKSFSYGEMLSCGFRKDVLDTRISLLDKKRDIISDDSFRKIVLDHFETGKFYNNKEIKATLLELSKEAGFEDAKLKACDLGNYFLIKKALITNRITGEKEHGYRILSIKE
jgi:hypothetical protein